MLRGIRFNVAFCAFDILCQSRQEFLEDMKRDIVTSLFQICFTIFGPESITVDVLLGCPDDVLCVKLEQKPDRKETLEIFTLMVDNAGSIFVSVVSKVLSHFPQRKTTQKRGRHIMKVFSLVEPGQRIRFAVPICVYFFLVKVDGDFELTRPKQTPGMDCPVVIKLGTSHHEIDHEWEDTEDFHKVLCAIEIGQIFWLLVRDKLFVEKILCRSQVELSCTH
mmetsp:Transcript_80026/g.222612  ORF Transcript_80026/g.222612 Transcript_80026/m.222612 type:complete len:221 (-) Transcript_80026:348-1010(-)